VLKQAGCSGMPVIHVKVGFRLKFPKISPRNAPYLAPSRGSVNRQHLFEDAAGAIHPSVAPEGDDIVVTKHRPSFRRHGSGDDPGRQGYGCLVLFGVAISGMVLSTLRTLTTAWL